MAEKDLGQQILLRMSQLEEVKNRYEGRDYDIARYVNPRRELIRDSQRFDDKGKARGKQAYTGEPNAALSTWADGMQGHMVSQSLRWFRSVMGDPQMNKIDEVQKWLQVYDEAMYAEFNNSNFYTILGEWFRDAGSIGTATLFTEEDMGREVSVHIPIHPREIFIAENKHGEVDTVFRKFFLTAKQALDKFGKDNVSQNIIDNAADKPETRHEFIHAVFPNDDMMFGSLLAIHKPWASVYLETSKDKKVEVDGVARRSGFDLNPYAVWRLRKNSDEIYGYSPAADAMVDIIKLNQMSKTLLKAAHRAVEPALNVPEHMRGNVRIGPDGFNYTKADGNKITAVQTGMNYPIAIDREDKIEQIINDKYRTDFFLILTRSEREKTATEIMELQSEKAVLLGPQVDRLEKEGLTKVFDIVSDIADKAGRLPEPPPILQDLGGRIDIRFIGPLAQAQRRLFQMTPIKNGLNELAQASVLYPKVLDKVNPNKLADRILDSTDFPQDITNTPEEVTAIQEQRELDLQKQQAQELLGGAAEGYSKTTKAPEQGSIAEELVGAA